MSSSLSVSAENLQNDAVNEQLLSVFWCFVYISNC